MAKVTSQEIIDLGLTAELFRATAESDFLTLIDSVIAEQSVILEGRLGLSIYASATSPEKDYVKRAEKCLAAAEMVQRRINTIMANVVGAGQEIDISREGRQRNIYLKEAEELISRLVTGSSTDSGTCVFGVSLSDHFDT